MGIFSKSERSGKDKVGYAVVGLGHIAQVAVLPAFKHAENSELVALCSGDQTKLRELGAKYDIEATYSYEDFDKCLQNEAVDAVYIALPNHLHREYAERAARAGVHVLCEKPMAVTETDCAAMIRAAQEGDVKLMIAYRLHFDEATLTAIQACQSGAIGEARFFSSDFCMQVRDENYRTSAGMGGGPLYDIGIYCLNAARSIFRSEPTEVFASSASKKDERFREIDEMVSAVLRFPQERLATFTCSFGAADVGTYRVVGTKGDLRAEPGYSYSTEQRHYLTVEGKTKERSFHKRDQFAAELVAFSQCVLLGKTPEPAGEEGLADVRVIEALQRSLTTGQPVKLPPLERAARPSLEQQIDRPPVKEPKVVHAAPPHE